MNKKEQRKLLSEIMKEDERDGLYELKLKELISKQPPKGKKVDIKLR